MLKNEIPKSVQGAWLTNEDRHILMIEAAKMGLRSATRLASIVLEEYCHRKRLEQAQQTIESARKRRGKDDQAQEGPAVN